MGWSLVGAGVVSLGAGGGMWFGPFADAKSTRDQTLGRRYQREEGRRYQTVSETEEKVK